MLSSKAAERQFIPNRTADREPISFKGGIEGKYGETA
jgi:hypothetical protein